MRAAIDGDAVASGALNFVRHVLRAAGKLGRDRYHDAAGSDGSFDRFTPFGGRRDVPRCNPAREPVSLQQAPELVGEALVGC